MSLYLLTISKFLSNVIFPDMPRTMPHRITQSLFTYVYIYIIKIKLPLTQSCLSFTKAT